MNKRGLMFKLLIVVAIVVLVVGAYYYYKLRTEGLEFKTDSGIVVNVNYEEPDSDDVNTPTNERIVEVPNLPENATTNSTEINETEGNSTENDSNVTNSTEINETVVNSTSP